MVFEEIFVWLENWKFFELQDDIRIHKEQTCVPLNTHVCVTDFNARTYIFSSIGLYGT
jgi:hypothetical protein